MTKSKPLAGNGPDAMCNMGGINADHSNCGKTGKASIMTTATYEIPNKDDTGVAKPSPTSVMGKGCEAIYPVSPTVTNQAAAGCVRSARARAEGLFEEILNETIKGV